MFPSLILTVPTVMTVLHRDESRGTPITRIPVKDHKFRVVSASGAELRSRPTFVGACG